MKKVLLIVTSFVIIFTLCSCDKPSSEPCSMCGDEVAYVYDNELGIGEETLSLCKDCHKDFVEAIESLNRLSVNK